MSRVRPRAARSIAQHLKRADREERSAVFVVGRDRSNGGCHALVGGPQFGDRLAVESLAVVADGLEDRGRRNPLDGVVFLAQFDLAGFAVEQVRVDDPLAREVRVLERDRPPGANERDGVGLGLPVSSRISTRTCSSGSPSANPETPPHRPQ